MTVYFYHATSFCGAVWDPVRARLEGVDTFAWDHPGHGRGPHLDLPVDWRVFGEYVLEMTEPGGVGVGHSMGAAALAMAQAEDPDRFRALVLIEPIVFPGPYRREDRDSMARTAERRRPVFRSRQAAAEHFRGRVPFENWVDSAFDAYIECGLVGDDEATLACRPEVEADICRGWKAHDTWERLGAIEIPVLVMAGEHSDTITPRLRPPTGRPVPSGRGRDRCRHGSLPPDGAARPGGRPGAPSRRGGGCHLGVS
ncbi:MAG TPA: alpha/beta hydrolase [Acidimicrobiia bacterium]|nr:alpha/beta hydrolase [Acidimicrobiia bacterium]